MTPDKLLTLLTLMLCNAVGAMALANVGRSGNKPRVPIKDTSISHVPEKCVLDAETGRCRASMRKYYFNVKSGQCEPFLYGGCGGNGNRFDSLPECHKTCTCRTVPETGPCRGHFRRWFYSPADGCCRPFIYGGCGGNSNNHATWTECSNMCGYPTQDSKWWDWGADWWRWNGQMNQTSGGAAASNRRYSRADFMRDWLLWRLLTGGEGELEMENLATLIAEAHILGFGRATGSGAGSGSGTGTGTGTGSGTGYRTGEGAATGHVAGFGSGAGAGAGYGAGYGSGAVGAGGYQSGASMGAGSNIAQGSGYSMADTQAALAYFQRFFGGEAEAETGLGLAAMLGAGGQNVGGFGPAYNVRGAQSFTPLGAMGSNENMLGMAAGMYNNYDTNGETNGYGNHGVYGGLYQLGAGQYGQGGPAGLGPGGAYNQWGTGQYGQGQSGQGLAGSMKQWGTGQFGRGQSGQAQAGGLNRWGAGHSGLGQSGQGHASAGSAGSKGINASAGAGKWHGSWGQRSSQTLGNTRTGWAPHGENVLPYGQGGVIMNILRLIGQLSSGDLKPVDLIGLGQRYGALQQDGKVNVEVLARGIVNTLKGPAGHAHLTQLKGIANTLGALDANGKININVMMKEIAKALSHGNKGIGKALADGDLFGKSGGAGQIVQLLGQWISGQLNPADFSALAHRFGAMQPGGKVNVDILAQRMVNSLEGPAGQAQLAQLKGIAKALGALDINGNINVNLLMKEMTKAFGRRNMGQGAGVGTGLGQFGTGGEAGSGSIQASGTMTIGGKKRKSYGKK